MARGTWFVVAVGVGGIGSAFGLLGVFLATHDIFHDYASPEVWARAGQPLPAWYSHGNQTPGEWQAMPAGFLLILAFHVLLAVRRTHWPALD
jgi:hypothetical protein